MGLENFTVAQGIKVQQEDLSNWEKILTTSAFKALVEYAESKNETAKDGYGIIRGDDLSVFLSNFSRDYKVEVKPTKAQKSWIKKTLKYLVFNEDESDQTILNTIATIRDHEDQDAMIDYLLGDEIFPVQRFEYTFTCKDFLEQIGYK